MSTGRVTVEGLVPGLLIPQFCLPAVGVPVRSVVGVPDITTVPPQDRTLHGSLFVCREDQSPNRRTDVSDLSSGSYRLPCKTR